MQQQQFIRNFQQVVHPQQIQQTISNRPPQSQNATIKVIHQVVVDKNLPGPCPICNHFPFIGDPKGALQKCKEQIETMRKMENLNLKEKLDNAIQQNENLKKSRLSGQNLNLSNQAEVLNNNQNNNSQNLSKNNSLIIQNYENNDDNQMNQEVEDIVKKYMNYA